MTITEEREEAQTSTDWVVIHFYCRCQLSPDGRWQNPLEAMCGHVMASPVVTVFEEGKHPVDSCLVCIDLEAVNAVCRLCGRPARTR